MGFLRFKRLRHMMSLGLKLITIVIEFGYIHSCSFKEELYVGHSIHLNPQNSTLRFNLRLIWISRLEKEHKRENQHSDIAKEEKSLHPKKENIY